MSIRFWRYGGLALVLLASGARAGPAPRHDPALDHYLRQAMAERRSGFHSPIVARVWLRVMSRRLRPYVANPRDRTRLLLAVHTAAVEAHVSPELVLSIINVESDFHRFAVSTTGAQGLMQIMPFWLRQIGRPGDNLFQMQTNLRIGCAILYYYLHRAHGDYALALQNYYGQRDGTGYAHRVLTLLTDRWYWH
jgi:soluble lytic murein transglycosylase-like protein